MTRPTLMLLPGLLCDRTVWLEQIRELSETWVCIVPNYEDLPSLGEMAEAVLARAPETFSMAGHSMGGRVAMEVMRRAPQRVRALALLDTAYRPLAAGPDGEREVEGRMRLVNMAYESGMRAMGREWLQGMVHPHRLADADLCERILGMIESKSPAVFEGQINALIRRPDTADVLRRIDCPTTFICGRQDAWSPLDLHYEMAELVADATVVPIEACGHMSTMERPDQVTDALRKGLGR